jgi:anti-anti-sigma factor
MDKGKVLHATQEGVHVLRFVGDIRYPLAPSVNRFVDDLFRDSVPSGFVIDLTETKVIDSTSLGALARIAHRMRQCGGPRVTIVSNRQDINEVLANMHFYKVFDIVAPSGAAVEWGELVPEHEMDRSEMTRTVIETHRALMALSVSNRELFRDLVAALEKEEVARSGVGSSNK